MTAGLLLAAGAGRRMGGPKALLHDRGGVAFLDRSLRVLQAGGCRTLTVVLGAEADAARAVLAVTGWLEAAEGDPGPGADEGARRVTVTVAEDWDEGMGASLRAGLSALGTGDEPSALVSLVDLPDVDEQVLRRVVAAGDGPGALVRATFDGRPGHPVLLGREHWPGITATARGDQGAREYFRAHPPTPCECGDLATGRDVDRPRDL